MSDKRQENLVKTSIGRIILHLTALNKDFKFGWHIKGIKRELVT
jgi:hypothetical protein